MKRCFKVSKAYSNPISASRASKKRLRRIPLNDILSRRMALRTHSLPSGLLKKRLCWSRWSVVSRSWKIMYRKKLLLPSRLSDVSCRRLTQRNHDVPSGSLKKRLWWSRWSDDSWCLKAMWNHILHPGHRKRRILRSHLSDILIRRMYLSTYNLHSGTLRTQLCGNRWSDVSNCR
jgi:hypothetical protein